MELFDVSIAASDETLRDDCASSDETFDKDVFAKYLNALRNYQQALAVLGEN